MRANAFLALLASTAVPAAAAPAVTGAETAQVVHVDLSNFRITPSKLQLTHGRAYVLEIVNHSSNGHDFTARTLFESSRIQPADSKKIKDGTIEVPANGTATIGFVPSRAGKFEFHCAHAFHSVLGMKGRVDVL